MFRVSTTSYASPATSAADNELSANRIDKIGASGRPTTANQTVTATKLALILGHPRRSRTCAVVTSRQWRQPDNDKLCNEYLTGGACAGIVSGFPAAMFVSGCGRRAVD